MELGNKLPNNIIIPYKENTSIDGKFIKPTYATIDSATLKVDYAIIQNDTEINWGQFRRLLLPECPILKNEETKKNISCKDINLAIIPFSADFYSNLDNASFLLNVAGHCLGCKKNIFRRCNDKFLEDFYSAQTRNLENIMGHVNSYCKSPVFKDRLAYIHSDVAANFIAKHDA